MGRKLRVVSVTRDIQEKEDTSDTVKVKVKRMSCEGVGGCGSGMGVGIFLVTMTAPTQHRELRQSLLLINT